MRRCWLAAVCLAALVGAAPADGAVRFGLRVGAAGGSGGRLIVPGFAGYPAWSPDGSRIAFVKGRTLSTVALDGTGRTVVLRQVDRDIWWPAWSPDGTRLAFVTDTETRPALEVVRADGTGLRWLTGGLDDNFGAPAWSPDGTRLATVRGEFDQRIDVVRADGTGRRTLRHVLLEGAEWGGTPTWSPDGRRILFSDQRRLGVATMDPDGTHVRRLGRHFAESPAWSPDGRWVACVALRARHRRMYESIDVIDTQTGRGKTVSPRWRFVDRPPLTPVWSPDGRRLAYQQPTPGLVASLWVADLATGQRTRLSRHALQLDVAASWSPAGSRLAYVTVPRAINRLAG
jgi:Tol biopolymer transport system component